MLWTIQRVYLGPPNEKYLKLPEINGREMFTLVPLGAIVIIVGVYPKRRLGSVARVAGSDQSSDYAASLSATMDLKNVDSLSFFYPEFILSGTILLFIVLDLLVPGKSTACADRAWSVAWQR